MVTPGTSACDSVCFKRSPLRLGSPTTQHPRPHRAARCACGPRAHPAPRDFPVPVGTEDLPSPTGPARRLPVLQNAPQQLRPQSKVPKCSGTKPKSPYRAAAALPRGQRATRSHHFSLPGSQLGFRDNSQRFTRA